jgi:tetratricopeptide (TPR) repeat protein
MLGEWEAAEASSRKALGLADGAGLGFVSALARHNLGLPLIRLGRVEEGLIELRAALETFRAQEHRRLLLGTHEHIALALAALGDLPSAEAHAEIAVDLGRSGELATRPLAVLSLIRLDRGNSEGALLAAEQALATRELGHSAAFVRLAHAEALAAVGDRDRARESALVGRDWLMTRAASIADAGRRETFLVRIPEHSRLLRRAAT